MPRWKIFIVCLSIACFTIVALLTINILSGTVEEPITNESATHIRVGMAPVNQANPDRTELMIAARNGDLAEVNALLEKGVDINEQTSSGSTALMIAAFMGHLDVVKALVNKGADINIKDSSDGTALYRALLWDHSDIFQFLLEKGARDDKALFLAVMQGSTSPVNAMLKNVIDVNGPRFGKGITLLMAAAQMGHKDIVESLLDKGADVNIQDEDGRTALMDAVGTRNIAIIQLLMAHGADENIRDKKGQSAITLVDDADSEQNWILKALLAYRADEDAKNAGEETVSIYGERQGLEDISKGILYWADGKDGVDLHIYLPGQKKDNVFLTIKNEPDLFKWTMDMKTLFYVSGDELFRVDWKWGAQPESMLTIPLEGVTAHIKTTYIDKSTNRWRTAYVLEGFNEDDIVTVKKEDGEEYYLMHGNDKITFKEKYYKDYGGLAIMQEFILGHGWQIIAKRMTSCGAQSSPCLDIIEDLYDPVPMISSGDLRNNMRINNTLKVAERLEGTYQRGIIYMPSWSIINRGLKVKFSFGDSYHAITPLIYVDKDSNAETIIYNEDASCNDFEQLGFEEYNGYLLVGTEYQSKCACVIDMKDGTTVFVPPYESSVVWVELPE